MVTVVLSRSTNPKAHCLRPSHWLCLGLGLLGTGLTAYLSLRASPALSTVTWLPSGLAHWADANARFDNFPAFGLVAFPFFLLARRRRHLAGAAVGLILFLTGLECLQRLLPHRQCDAWDIFWGGAGILASGLLVFGCRWGIAKIRSTPVFPTVP